MADKIQPAQLQNAQRTTHLTTPTGALDQQFDTRHRVMGALSGRKGKAEMCRAPSNQPDWS